jgi:hypothetical protein
MGIVSSALMGDTGSWTPLKVKAALEAHLIVGYQKDAELWFDTDASSSYYFVLATKGLQASVGGTSLMRFYHTGDTTACVIRMHSLGSVFSDNAAAVDADSGTHAFSASDFTTAFALAGTAAAFANFNYYSRWFEGSLITGASGGRFGLEWGAVDTPAQTRMYDRAWLYRYKA